MPSSHIECIHHESHDARIVRSEKDIQDIFKIIDKMEVALSKTQMSIFKIVSSLTAAGVVGNYLIQTFGGK